MAVRPATIRQRRALLVAARRVMREHMADSAVDLGDVAAAVGCSARQLQRVFAEVGESDFRTELLELRMRHARRLLERGESVRAAAPRVGYSGPSGLVAAFKRVYGVPPSAVQPAPLDYDEPWRTAERARSATAGTS